MRAVVVTSIDPARDRAGQMRALAAWTARGAQAFSGNTPRDAALLRSKGLETQHSLEISPRDTWLNATGQATPLIVPLLHHVADHFADHALVLTAPGVYPALADAPTCLRHWLQKSPALALTTDTTPLLECHRYSQDLPQRRDLAAFVLAPDRILPLASRLAQWPIAEEMCLGDMGWDLLLGAVIAETDFGGVIADSGVLLREDDSLPRDHGDLQDLAPYIKPLRTAGLGAAPSATDLLKDCTDQITAACTAQAPLTAEIKAFHYAPVPPPQDLPAECLALAQDLQHMIPWVRWNYALDMLALLAQRISAEPPLTFDRTCQALRSGPNLQHQRSEVLLATLMHLRAATEPVELSTDYATTTEVADHVSALHRLQTADPDLTDPATQLQLVQLWGDEVCQTRTSNPRLQDAVALLCQNDDDRHLFDAITAYRQDFSDAA